MGKVTISTVLGYKEYVVENIKNIRGEDEENSDFRIYPDYHKIYRGQTEIVLTKAEYELFMLLSGRPGVIFTKEKIFEILYNEEYFIPSVASDLLHDGKASLEVLVSKDQWYGVTYPEDKQSVIDALAALRENGTYKF